MSRLVSYSALFLVVAIVAGCGPRGPRTHPVQGKIEIKGGEVEHLAGSHIEGALATDNSIRTSGVIQKDGSFKLETLHEGAPQGGAREGKYEARIVIADDNREARRKAEQALAPRFLDFKKSGLTFDVPASGPISLVVSGR